MEIRPRTGLDMELQSFVMPAPRFAGMRRRHPCRSGFNIPCGNDRTAGSAQTDRDVQIRVVRFIEC
jgi:hypothetical protein